MKGQSDLITTIVLVGVTIVIGVGLLAFAVPNISRLMAENSVKSALYEEQSNLIIYRELENSTTLCIGLLRISPAYIAYSIAILDENLNSVANPINIVKLPQYEGTLQQRLVTPPRRVYYLYSGVYYPIPGEIHVIEIPGGLISNYIERGRPLLLCIRKDVLRESVRMAKIFILASLNNNLYEVGRIYVYS
ncbi:MAG: hypothetical protein QXV81_05080 [Ignisphaera sp.]